MSLFRQSSSIRIVRIQLTRQIFSHNNFDKNITFNKFNFNKVNFIPSHFRAKPWKLDVKSISTIF